MKSNLVSGLLLMTAMIIAFQNVIFKDRLSKTSPLIIILSSNLVMLLLGLIGLLLSRYLDWKVSLPEEGRGHFLLINGLLSFSAACCFLSTYNLDVSLIGATMTNYLIPIFAILIKFGLDREWPSGRHWLAFLLALAAIFIVTRK